MTDRGQAISLVEAALKSGRIVQADHDMRIDQIKNAPSEQDIDMIVRDLRPPARRRSGSHRTAPRPARRRRRRRPWPAVAAGQLRPGPGPARGDHHARGRRRQEDRRHHRHRRPAQRHRADRRRGHRAGDREGHLRRDQLRRARRRDDLPPRAGAGRQRRQRAHRRRLRGHGVRPRGGVGLDRGLQRGPLPALRGALRAGRRHGQALRVLLLGRRDARRPTTARRPATTPASTSTWWTRR